MQEFTNFFDKTLDYTLSKINNDISFELFHRSYSEFTNKFTVFINKKSINIEYIEADAAQTLSLSEACVHKILDYLPLGLSKTSNIVGEPLNQYDALKYSPAIIFLNPSKIKDIKNSLYFRKKITTDRGFNYVADFANSNIVLSDRLNNPLLIRKAGNGIIYDTRFKETNTSIQINFYLRIPNITLKYSGIMTF